MIRSMTAFGSGRTESPQGTVSVECRTVNSRYLDINFRLPDDLRMAEGALREELGKVLKRGKIDLRVNYTRADTGGRPVLDVDYARDMAAQLAQARKIIPDLPAPRLAELMVSGTESEGFDPDTWTAMCREAAAQAIGQLQEAREREGQRLADMMLDCAAQVSAIVDEVEKDLPAMLAEHQAKLGNKLRDALTSASPEGYMHITGPELSARIAQEASLFSLRIDVAEELSRMRSHIAELQHLLGSDTRAKGAVSGKSGGSAGKRLDFLFQEMNREANTLGSKASALSVTRAAIDLKLLIEQMREQAQNIE